MKYLLMTLMMFSARFALADLPAPSFADQALVRVVLSEISKNGLIQSGVNDISGQAASPLELNGVNALIQNVLGLTNATTATIDGFSCTALVGEQSLCTIHLSSPGASGGFAVHIHQDGTVGTIESLLYAF